MPFKSEKQRRYLWMAHPDIAEKWAHGQEAGKGKRSSKRSSRKSGRK